MSQAESKVVPLNKRKLEIVTLTPDTAKDLLEGNKLNRPLDQTHVNRIERQIATNKWKFNGDTIKVSVDGDILDGQHRLWAIFQSGKSVETVIVHGVARDAFSTVDTLRKHRGGADILSLNGVNRYRVVAAAALTWLLRYQRGVLPDYRNPKHKIENSDIEEAYAHHPAILEAVERTAFCRKLYAPSVIGFFYYVLANRNQEIAERFLEVLENPAGASVRDPFFRLRSNLLDIKHARRDTLVVIAWCIKAANAVKSGEKMEKLVWRNQGERREEFPKLKV
jgi:hypothetical protein